MILVWIVTSLVVFSLLKLLVTSLPSGVVERLFSRYAVHAKVTSDQTTIMFEDRPLNDQQVSEIIRHFNDAIFIERYYIYPGDEERFLHPQEGPAPLTMQTKLGKHDVTLYLYHYDDHVDVVRQFTHKPKKKLTAYRLRSEPLQTSHNLAHA
ncbi:YfmQ family protein [Bacillus pumilus]|nr:YfmQ family protein [Bacillus pumilus]MDF2001254.1 YfmQ family protein [Bacillus pumilus]MDF2022509.1 YfmQ family protein [Bacillus pumilus]MDF2026136.1 YfmQ family protein [Bacillus pumilus]MDF2087319.1 YfmQ family protein [Bacillus pumilus]MDG4726946.1 YfmQ family protein [Bacillus pumilus]